MGRVMARMLAIGGLLLAAAACSRDADPATELAWNASSASPEPLLRTRPWVDDFRVGRPSTAAAGDLQRDDEFAPGEPIQLTMAINYAPRGAMVATYWYGPNDEPLGYQVQELSAARERLRFLQAGTGTWPQGGYRVEVWIADYKLGERRFRVTSTESEPGSVKGRSTEPLQRARP